METRTSFFVRKHLPEVLRIETEQFEFPWDEEMFVDLMKCNRTIGMVAEREGKVVGYVVYELHRKHMEILNLAVDPDTLRSGVGSVIVQKLVGKLQPQRRNRICTFVRETNLQAQQFFRAVGFRATRVHHDYYTDGKHEDAYQMDFVLRRKKLTNPTNRITSLRMA